MHYRCYECGDSVIYEVFTFHHKYTKTYITKESNVRNDDGYSYRCVLRSDLLFYILDKV